LSDNYSHYGYRRSEVGDPRQHKSSYNSSCIILKTYDTELYSSIEEEPQFRRRTIDIEWPTPRLYTTNRYQTSR